MSPIDFSYKSLIALPIEILHGQNDEVLSHATGFLYNWNNKKYLLTNWHVVTGKNPETHRPLSKQGNMPDKLRFPLLRVISAPPIWQSFVIPLYCNNEGHKLLWLEHPTLKEKADVVAIEVTLPAEFDPVPVNDQRLSFRNLKAEPGDEIFILGFPYNIIQGQGFPVWKRASIATEPNYNYKEKPMMLVDTATRSGMSGAPVILRRKTNWSGHGQVGDWFGFIGIYSGRFVGDTELEAQLGIVWRKEVIEEILLGNT